MKIRNLISILLLLNAVNCPAKTLINNFCSSILLGQPTTWVINTPAGPHELKGRAQRISSYFLDSAPGTSSGRMGQFSTSEIVSETDSDHFILIQRKIKYRSEYPPLWQAALRRPEQMAAFDIYADEDQFLMGDGNHFTNILKNRDSRSPKIVDISIFRNQWYTDAQFFHHYSRGEVILAKRDKMKLMQDGFYHDRLEEHMIAILAIPAELFQETVALSRLGSKEPSQLWDILSGFLGRSLIRMMLQDTVTGRDIQQIAQTLQNWSKYSVNPDRWVNRAEFEQMAIQIIHDFQGTPIETLRQIWHEAKENPANQSPKIGL